MAKPEYSGPWRRLRLKILERDGHECQVRGPKCTGRATQVDHIVPTSKGGSWFDPDNLRSSCQPCNRDRVKRGKAWRNGATRIVLVVGPPGAGKSTYVEQHRAPGDLVVDYDRLAEALGSPVDHGHADELHPTVMAARNAVLSQIRLGKTQAGRAWIISANPRAEEVFPYHEVVVVDPARDAVVSQARGAGRPEGFVGLIDGWYAAREGGVQVVQGAGASREW